MTKDWASFTFAWLLPQNRYEDFRAEWNKLRKINVVQSVCVGDSSYGEYHEIQINTHKNKMGKNQSTP